VGTSHRYLAKLHDELALGADVYSIDLPGFGGLPKPGTAPGVTEMAHALGGVLRALSIRKAVLIGHSMGVQWVTELAVLAPEFAGAVVVIGPVADDAHRSLVAQSVALAIDVLGEPPTVNTTVFLDYLRCGPVWYLKQARHMVSYRIEDRVPRLTMPFLVIRGGNDPIAGRSWCRRLCGRAEQGSFVTVPGHRHVVQFTAPRAVASAIEAFVHDHRQRTEAP
jgi:pimeloyl-ACP methyl ester carboxylesterase